jgi:hypothetical protein
MKKLTSTLLILLLISCLTKENPVIESQEQQTPDYQVAVKFINDYKDFCDQVMFNHDTTLNTADWITKNELLSPNFKKQYHSILDAAEKADPGYGLGFDPIFNAQDYTDGIFEIKEVDSASHLVIVIGKEDSFETILKVVRINNKTFVEGAGIINIPKEKQRKI